MAFPNESSRMVDADFEIAALKEVLRVFNRDTSEITVKLQAQIAEAEEKLRERDSKAKTDLYKHLAELQVQGVIKSNEEAIKYIKQEESYRETLRTKQQKDIELAERKRLEEANKEKLESEIALLTYISKENEKEREREQKRLEAEKQILELRAAGNEEEAKQKEKELAQQKKKDKKEERKKEIQDQTQGYEFGDILKEGFQGFTDALADENHAKKVADENLANVMKGVGKAIQDGLNAINNAISEYAKYQGSINARLQGVSSYAESVKTLSGVAFSPLLKAEDLYANLADLVGQGIVTNVEQRAMLATVKDSVAQTFDVTSDSLKRLIRVQQNDSTAARMGMEAYLTHFLNVYVENTEYLQSTFDTVSSSLLEASAMMYLSNSKSGAGASAELEYVIQKWLGTLSGIGLSDTAAQSIADALGQLGSGNVDALGSSDIQNLIVMAASKVGLNYGEMLNTGIDAKQANDLMLGAVEYLKDVANTGTNVVKSQLANVFGVTVSDLVAVNNLGDSALKKVHSDMLSYSGMYGELTAQFKELPERLGISNILENLFSNLTYQTGMSIGSNPALFALWKITDMIQGVTGGINVPFISAFGNGFDLNTTVENLMKIGIVGVSTLGNIGKIASGLSSIGDGSALLKKLKVSEGSAVIKTTGGSSSSNGKRQSGSTTSESTYVGNNDGDTYAESAQNAANDDAQSKLDQKASEYEDPVVKYLDEELKLGSLLEATNSKIDTLVENQNKMVQSQGLMLSSQLLMNNDLAATYAAVNLLVALMQRSTLPTDAAPGAPVQDLTATVELPDYSEIDALIRTRGNVEAISADSITAALEGAVTSAQKASQSSSGSGSGGSGKGGSSSGGSGGAGGTITPTAGAGSAAGNAGGDAGDTNSGAVEAAGNAAASAGNAAANASQAAAEATGAVSAAANAASAAASAATTMAELSANSGLDALSAILSEILLQNKQTEASMLTAVSPVAASLIDINSGMLSTLSALAALNGSVVTGVENLAEQFNAIFETKSLIAESAYTNYTENISKDIDTTYSTIAGDVSTQVEIIKDMMNADINSDAAGNTNIDLYFTAPEINIDNEVKTQSPEVNVQNDINVQPADVNLNPQIDVTSPEVSVDLQNNVSVQSPDVTVNTEAPQVNVGTPNVLVDPTIQVDVTSPDIALAPNIDVTSPDVNLDNNVVVNTQPPVIDVTAPDINIPAIENPDVYVDNTLNPEIVVNPEIVNTVPGAVLTPDINVEVPEIQVPDVSVNAPDVSVVVDNATPEINPEVVVNPEVTVDASGLVLTPEVTVNPEITNTVPNVNIDNEIINTPPEVLVDNNIINQIPPILVHNEIINKAPDVNLVNVNKIATDLPDIYVEVKNAVNVQPPQVINMTTFNPNIINTVPDVSVYPEIINNIPDVVLNPEIVTNVTPPTVINQSEIVNTVPNVYVEAPEVNVPKSDVYVEAIIPEINNQVKVAPETPEVNPEIEVMEEINITVPPAPPATVVVEDLEARPNQIIVNPQVDVQAIIPEVILNPDIKVAVPDINLTEDISVSAPPITFNPTIDVLNTVPNVNLSPNIINEIPAPEIAVDPQIVFTVPNITVNPEIINEVPDVQVTSTVVVPDLEDNKSNRDTIQDTDYSRFILESGVVNTIVSSASSASDVTDYLIAMDFSDGFKLLVDNVSKIKQLIERDGDESQSVTEFSEISGFTTYTFNN